MSGKTVYDRLTETGRWNIHHERVFKHDDRYYRTHYSLGATEYQEERPYEDAGDEIECTEVFPCERVVTVYETR